MTYSAEDLRECADALEWDGGYTLPIRQIWPQGPLVYFVGADNGPVKIGFTKNICSRLGDLQTACPAPLKLLAYRRGFQPTEAGYHKRFAHCRLHGEWFERTPEIEAEIDRLRRL